MPIARKFLKNGFIVSVPFYVELLERFEGALPHDLEAHALWDYYIRAAKEWAGHVSDTNKYEGEVYAEPNLRQLFLSIAKMHDVDPEKMGQYWSAMQKQRFKLGLSLNADLPLKFQFRGLKFP